MNTYIVLLRGINVGGKNKLPMVDLRELLSENGYQNVSTYIQSGNIILSSSNSIDYINNDIKNLIKNAFNYTTPVVTLTTDELTRCYNNNPFLTTENDSKFLHVTFIKHPPTKQTITTLNIHTQENESYQIIDKFIYLHTPDGFAKTKFTNIQFEKKLQTEATTRNWRTVSKLVSLVSSN